MVPIEKSKCPNAPWKKTLARYRRLVSCMLEESLGYFTPKAAVMAIEAHKKGEYWGCEWYGHIDYCRGNTWDDNYKERIKEINRDVIRDAFKGRKHYRKNEGARLIVDVNIGNHDSVLASWF